MTRKPARPKPPAGLKRSGKALWRAIVGDLGDDWELDQRERHLLLGAARCADELAVLEQAVDRDGPITIGSRGQTVVHPGISEARQLRLVQLRLLGAIEVVDPKTAARPATPAQSQARKAAAARWADLPRRGAGRG